MTAISNVVNLSEQRIRRERWRWQEAVLRVPHANLGLAAKVVAAALVAFVNERTGIAWPSHATLARASGLCERSVRDALNALEDAGFIRRSRRGGGTTTGDNGRRKGRTTAFEISIPGTGMPGSDGCIPGTAAPSYPATPLQNTRHTRADEPSIEPPKAEPKNTKARGLQELRSKHDPEASKRGQRVDSFPTSSGISTETARESFTERAPLSSSECARAREAVAVPPPTADQRAAWGDRWPAADAVARFHRAHHDTKSDPDGRIVTGGEYVLRIEASRLLGYTLDNGFLTDGQARDRWAVDQISTPVRDELARRAESRRLHLADLAAALATAGIAPEVLKK